MAGDFYANNELVWVEFKTGYKVALKSEMDAGDQDALEKEMMKISDGEASMQPGSLKLLELNVVKIIEPDGKEIVPTPAQIRKLSRSVMGRLLSKVQELNRPLAELAQE